MKITVLGSGSAFSSPTRFNSCYVLEAAGEKFMIDCGSDAMKALQKGGVGLSSVRNIFITHMHADHAAGLPAVLTAMHVHGRRAPISVHIPFTQLDFAKTWLANMFIYDERLSFRISLEPLKPGVVRLGSPVELEFFHTRHLQKYEKYAASFGIEPVSYAVIVREGEKVFFFSSDLASLDEVKGRLDGCVSLVEATHPNLDEVASLMTGGSGSVYFTHIPQELEEGGEWRAELAARFGVKEFRSVSDGQVIEI